MSLNIGDNFSYLGAKPLDNRLKYDTLAAMKAMADSVLYDGCLAYCIETGKTYQWISSNSVDTTLGKWREFESESGIELTQAEYDALTEAEKTNGKTYFITDGASGSGGGGSATYVAGNGINIDNDEISVDEMASTDMSEVASPMPSVMSRRFKYSTEEQVIGEWIDGKPLYQKTVDIGALPNATTKNVAHGISNLSNIISIWGTAKGTGMVPLPLPHTGGIMYQISLVVNDTIIAITDANDWSNYVGYVTLQYIKTTD